jgi:hypothetical protein
MQPLDGCLLAAARMMTTARMFEAHRVVQVTSPEGMPAPPEIAQRFQGRAWSLRQLEERGVRITGAAAWYLAAGKHWQLELEPI